jgi:predicted dehydrogenase
MSALPPGHAVGCIDAFRTVVLQGRLAMQDVSRRYPSFADGLHDVRLVEAAIRRAADRRTVEVET